MAHRDLDHFRSIRPEGGRRAGGHAPCKTGVKNHCAVGFRTGAQEGSHTHEAIVADQRNRHLGPGSRGLKQHHQGADRKMNVGCRRSLRIQHMTRRQFDTFELLCPWQVAALRQGGKHSVERMIGWQRVLRPAGVLGCGADMTERPTVYGQWPVQMFGIEHSLPNHRVELSPG